MLKDKKLEYQKQLETYLEEQNVFDIFQDMMKNLIIAQPKDPIQFLLTKLTSPEVKRLIIIGPPGCKRKEISLTLAESLQEENKFEVLSVGELLTREIIKKSEFGKQIVESKKTYSYVTDEIVINIVKHHIEQYESEQKSWIIEGFPRTRLQALALAEMKIIPDKFILLDIDETLSIEKIKKNLKSEETVVHYLEEDIDSLAHQALKEYKHHIEGVTDVCKGQIIELDGNKNEGIILEEIVRILRLNKTNAPRSPPRIMILGPPGCGKSLYAKRVAEKYRLSYIRVKNLIKDLIRAEGNTQRVIDLKNRLETQEQMPDELVLELVKERLNKPDCRINGWILDGCPTSQEQLEKLSEQGIIPSLVVALEVNDSLIYEKIEAKRFDPIDGVYYNIEKDNVNENIKRRLLWLPQHKHIIVEKKLVDYRNFLTLVETEYTKFLIRINAEEGQDIIVQNFYDAIENIVQS